MPVVLSVENLYKNFKTKIKPEGFKNKLKNFIKPAYKTIEAVKNISFAVEKGEMLAFIGPNGAGKSTTIKLITGILYPDKGNITVLGLNPHKKRKALSYKIGTVFGQKSQLWFHLPPLDSLYLLGSIYDLSKKETKRKIDFLTEVFELKEFLCQPVRKLSLGQRIRCEIAASLIHSPEILFLDEPSIGLDIVVKQKIRDLIKHINREDKVTIFLTSHDAGDIEKICRRVIVVNYGQIVWDGTIKDMKYGLLNKRIIDIKLDEPININMTGVTILKNKDYSVKLEIDLSKTSIEDVMQEIMKNHSILDINISNIPMEEIISMIYRGNV